MQQVKESIIKSLPYLRRYAYALTDDVQLADSMVQECVACALDLSHFWEEGQSAKVWLFGVFQNLHSDTLNKKKFHFRVKPTSAHVPDPLPMSKLSPLQKQAFLLIALEGFGYQEVADIMNISLGELLSYIHGARKVLRAELKKSQAVAKQPELAQ